MGEAPAVLTSAGARYFDGWIRLNDLLMFIVTTASRLDEARQIARDALDSRESPEPDQEDLGESEPVQLGPAMERLKRHRQLLMELLLCRHIDLYLTYVAGILKLIHVARPETLRDLPPPKPIQL
jgi:hypothetical protein